MRKIVIIFVSVVVLVAAGGWMWAAMKSDDTTSQDSATPSNQQQTNEGADQSSSKSTTVEIKNMMFTPSQVTIEKNTKVIWVNKDDMTHTVTVDKGEGPKSQSIEPGASYEFTFNSTGSFQYHCTFHSAMHGTVVVR